MERPVSVVTRLLVLPTLDWTPPGVGRDVLAGRDGPLLHFHHFLEDFYPLCLLEPIGGKIFLNNFFSKPFYATSFIRILGYFGFSTQKQLNAFILKPQNYQRQKFELQAVINIIELSN
jgi:hypothetical protein